MDFKTKEDLYLQYLEQFYTQNPGLIEKRIIPIIESRTKISLRFLEKFVTKYCNQKQLVIYHNTTTNGKKFCLVYNEYIDQLSTFGKEFFDPFKRKSSKKNNKILFKYNKNSMLLTTVGQLNFFRWLFEYQILDYIEEHYDSIAADMQKSAF
jgi:hypothetical protein